MGAGPPPPGWPIRGEEWWAAVPWSSVGDPDSQRVRQREPQLWFGKKEGALGFGPLTWQGRAATTLYVFLVVVAVFTYSQVTLTALVAVFYTITFGCVVMLKSDLLKHWPPGS